MGGFRIKRFVPVIIIFALILIFPLLYRTPYFLNGMVTAGYNAVLALSLSILLGQAGLLSFGNSAFAGLGAYTAAILIGRWNVPPLAAAAAGIVLTGLVAMIIGKPVLRFKLYFLALATMGLATIFTVLVMNFNKLTHGINGIAGLPFLSIFGFEFSELIHQYYLVWVVVLAVLLFLLAAMRSRVGRALRALASNEIAAQTLGIDTPAWKLRVFVVSAMLSAAAGTIWVVLITSIGPNNFAMWTSVAALIMVLIGGQSSLLGSVVGAVLITWLGLWLTRFQAYSNGIYSLILLLLVLFLPAGLAGLVASGKFPRLGRALAGYLKIPEWRARLFPPAGPQSEPAVVGQLSGPSVSLESRVSESDSPSQPHGSAPLGLPPPGSQPLLIIDDVTVAFGGLRAVSHVSLEIPPRTITALIGPNGAGKTTLFNAISGLQRLTEGRLSFAGHDITREDPHKIAQLGMARTFQNLRVFGNMSVLENVMVGCHKHEGSHFLTAGLRLPSQRKEERRSYESAMRLLERFKLADLADSPVTSLPYGQQRLVEIARALASEPSLLMLDEPAAGMNTGEREVLVEKIQDIYRSGVDVLIIEHDMDLIMGMSDHVAVLEHGSLICQGTPSQVQCDAGVIEAYLGTKDASEREAERRAKVRATTAIQASGEPLLEVQGLSTYYGSIGAVRDVDLHVMPGEIVAVLGANGAGKSTLMHTISGVLRPTRGKTIFEGRDISRLDSAKVADLGVALVPEGRHVFPTLTVLENLQLGAGKEYKGNVFRTRLESVYELFPILRERAEQTAGSLSGGEQQMLAISRGIMRAPRLLLIDEPSMGLAPLAVEVIFKALQELNSQGLTILMVEQNVEAALSIADRAVVMVTGEVVLSGSAAEVRDAPNLRELYLGVADLA